MWCFWQVMHVLWLSQKNKGPKQHKVESTSLTIKSQHLTRNRWWKQNFKLKYRFYLKHFWILSAEIIATHVFQHGLLFGECLKWSTDKSITGEIWLEFWFGGSKNTGRNPPRSQVCWHVSSQLLATNTEHANSQIYLQTAKFDFTQCFYSVND